MSSSSGAAGGRTARIGSRDQTYLIAKDAGLSPASAGPLDFGWLVEQLEADPAVVVETTLRPRNLALQQFGASPLQSVVVATMPEDTAHTLSAHPQIVLEPDHPLFPQPLRAGPGVPDDDPALLSPFGSDQQWTVRVESPLGPVAGATVWLYGRGVPAQGTTDVNGEVSLRLRNETDATLQALYVNPLRDHWSLWVDRPALVAGSVTSVTLRPLPDFLPAFPEQELLGWGQRAMRLDQVPAEFDGRGVRVAVIDSGAAVRTHPDLAAMRDGADFAGSGGAGSQEWTDDVIAHGSHCSGIIAGARNGHGIRGFAPAAVVHQARIFPGGRISSLLDAIDYCMDQRIDVVNMSLGTGGTSQLLLQKLAQAREQGMACIVAAGNSGDAVQFPGLSPDVLTVSAIGHEGTFPEDSYHAKQRWAPGGTDGGLFAAAFSCHGPEVDVAGPGVAVVSTVPDSGYAAWDGTSMATPHVAGLAALVLAHHPDFRSGALRLPTAARVERLFALLTGSCRTLDLGDPHRTGAGLPDALRALGLDGEVRAVEGESDVASHAIRAALEQVRLEMIAAGLLLEPAGVPGPGPLGGRDGDAPPADLRRELARLRAQMSAAGLLPARGDVALAATS